MMNTAIRLKRKMSARGKRDNIFAWAFLIPMSVYLAIFSFLPLAFVVVISFTDFQGLKFENIKFNGVENYKAFFTNPEYLTSLLNTVVMGVLILALTMVIGFFLALLMNSKIFARSFHRAAWYIPGIISFAVISQLIASMLEMDGILNVMLSKLGINPVMWKGSTAWMFFWIIIITVWRSLGTTILYYIAGLTGIPPELYEAADIEGCNKLQRMTHITLPMLKPMIAFILITSLINMFNIFEPVLLISKGGPEGSTNVIMVQIYEEAFNNFNMGMSSAISVVVMVIVLILTAVNLKITKLNI